MEPSLAALSGFLVGNRRPMRWVPKWEASSDLEKRLRFGSMRNDSKASGPLCEPVESSCCPLPIKLMENHEIILSACRKGD